MLKRLIYVSVLISVLQLPLGCGMLIYPERQKNDNGGVDPTVVVLDGAGLFLGVFPGLAALTVDALSGTMYLPNYDAEAKDDDSSKARISENGKPVKISTGASKPPRTNPKASS